MCNSSVINIRRVSLLPCQLPKVDPGQPIQIQLMGSAWLWKTQPNCEAPSNLLVQLVISNIAVKNIG